MTTDINEAIKKLVFELRGGAPSNTTSFSLFVNCQEAWVEWSTREPEDLKLEGISMRNLQGEFIK